MYVDETPPEGAMLCLVPAPKRLATGRDTSDQNDPIDQVAERTARFAIRRRAAILATGALVAMIAAYGVTQIQISTDVVKLFHPEHRVRVDFEAVQAHMRERRDGN